MPRAKRVPHVTVAEFITLDETHELVLQLADAVPGGTFLCDRVTYAVPDASFHFEPVLEVPLGAIKIELGRFDRQLCIRVSSCHRLGQN